MILKKEVSMEDWELFDSGYLKGNAILKFLIRLEFFFF